MELDWLETFLAVVDQGGFTAASTHVHRSQSRVSAHIAGLERALGAQLIDRHRRPAALTQAGEVFARHARTLLAQLDAARSELDLLEAARSNAVSVLTTPPLSSWLIPNLLPRLLARWPTAELTLLEAGWHPTANLDSSPPFAVAVLPVIERPLPAGVIENVLWRDRVQVVVPADHEWAAARVVPLLDLKASRLLIGSSAHDAQLPALSRLATHAVASTVVGSPRTVVDLVQRGVGLGLDTAVALHRVDRAGVVVLDVEDGDDGLLNEVAAYWTESVLSTGIGQALHQTLLDLPLPEGAIPLNR